ncbi:MAG: rane protein insertase, YidC/Oxa1 family [Frankiales bacterium]|nr:rane protein insertase, YidC/Oxa1 family [Frankiales bacterium]
MSIVDVIGFPVAQVLKGIHNGLSTVFPADGGLAWGLSIIFLTVFVRILLFPVFVKQIRSQRRMQEIAPKVKELQKLHKGDRETLNREMMTLYKDNNANPIAGCLPLILQLPVFFALFSVLKEFKPDAKPRFGLSAHDLAQGGHARIFGAPISAALNDPATFIQELGGNSTATRIVAVIMLITMGATTFITQRQMMARNTSADPTQMQVQKVLLYVLPLSFSIFGFSFPIGVLLYWLTTNLWSMGQQFFVIKRMPPPNLGGAPAGPRGTGKPGAETGKGSTALAEPAPRRWRGRGSGSADAPAVDLVKDTQVAAGRAPGTAAGSAGQPAKKAPQGSRKNRNRKKGRPGGRR